MKDGLKKLEIAGIFFVIILSVFLQNLFRLTDRNLIGVMFGSVNNSIWEFTKTLLLPYFLWSMIELLSVRMPFRKFVVSKTVSLYFLGLSYILITFVTNLLGLCTNALPELVAAVACVAMAQCLSLRLIRSDFSTKNLYLPSILLLLLFVSLFLSFTVFPPEMYIFKDRDTGLYGIIPQYIDRGAIALDTFYGFTD
ncbi:MAG: hypothetical protein J1E85_09670 [Ruminococcus sp.]|nr:hypothetical protein [Ruminococcus sp.]